MREKRIIVGSMGLAAAIAAMSLVTPAEAQDITRNREPYKHGIKAKSTQNKRRKLKKGRRRP